MELTRRCPICGNTNITPVLRKTVLDTSNPQESGIVLAYRCSTGHFFVASSRLVDDEARIQLAA